eukprot:12158058-Alexandrium_andersonii.AAC.1
MAAKPPALWPYTYQGQARALSKALEDLKLREQVDAAALLRSLRLLLSADLTTALAIWLLRLVDREQGAALFLAAIRGAGHGQSGPLGVPRCSRPLRGSVRLPGLRAGSS